MNRYFLTTLIVVACGIAPSIKAATFVGIVSDRSAPLLAAGAAHFHTAHPAHKILLRTPTQIADLTDRQISQLWSEADAVVLTAIFGTEVSRLSNLLRMSPPPAQAAVLAFNGDRRLTQLSRIKSKELLKNTSPVMLTQLHENPGPNHDFTTWLDSQKKRFPEYSTWLDARAYWQAGGSENLASLIAHSLSDAVPGLAVPPCQPQRAIRYLRDSQIVPARDVKFQEDQSVTVILDLDNGDAIGNRETITALTHALHQRSIPSLSVLARWGASSVEALRQLPSLVHPARIGTVINLQDFVTGGGDGRQAVTEIFNELNVPVIKAIRMTDQDQAEWRLSDEGLPWDSVHYRVAMPELQGVSQPTVVATATPPRIDELTGVRLTTTEPVPERIDLLAARTARWIHLQRAQNIDKRIALIYYNHPPGRHNIGADNLDVPASLWELLHLLKNAGYQTGPLPPTPEALLEQIQKRAVNLPEDNAALTAMAATATTVSAERYRDWFSRLPPLARAEMKDGPLGFLNATVREAAQLGKPGLAAKSVDRVIHDLEHLLEGVDHPAQDRALTLIEQLEELYGEILNGADLWEEADAHNRALAQTGIEGLGGWGPPPGNIMVRDQKIVLPGLILGNVFIGPQPPRGWELNEELLHANMAIPPPHQYLALYFWLREEFKADALVHLGRHSTYEFLPRRRTGLSGDDYPAIISADIPGIYPYIVDGIGEGIQAKRRGQAVIVDHLTPPLQTTPLYDELLQLRQLVESYESNEPGGNSPALERTMSAIRAKVAELNLEEELVTELKAEHRLGDIPFEEVDDDLLVHEIGHHLTEMQERFMPLGLHVFGRDWESDSLKTMLNSMRGDPNSVPDLDTEENLKHSPAAERQAFLNGLAGGFIAPGKGNDPIRTPEALPTGRNFHALDGSLLPTRIAWDLAGELATEARERHTNLSDSIAVVLWASDAVRDEGAMVAFGLQLLGVRPVWNSRGIVKGLERLPLISTERPPHRRDLVFTISGLFRDLYGHQVNLLDQAVLVALDGSSLFIRRQYPELAPALDKALARLEGSRNPDDETPEQNGVAAAWIAEMQQRHQAGEPPEIAGRLATLRLFGAPPGGYGAGVNRMVERSGSWQDRTDIARVYLQGMGHAYGSNIQGDAVHDTFERRLKNVGQTFLGRASNLYGLLDNNDAFDYQGGLSMAIEQLRGAPPVNQVIRHANPDNTRIENLETALLGELRGRFLNPAWLRPLMGHAYAGARTMGSEFVEYLWGWQVTNPDIVKSWAWDEVRDVYLRDRHQLGLDEFLESGQNVHVKINLMAILLVAAHKGYWEADELTLKQLAVDFARLVREHGLPGSGHTRPDHPMIDWVMPLLTTDLQQDLTEVINRTRGPEPKLTAAPPPATLAEITPSPLASDTEPTPPSAAEIEPASRKVPLAVLGVVAVLLIAGIIAGRSRP